MIKIIPEQVSFDDYDNLGPDVKVALHNLADRLKDSSGGGLEYITDNLEIYVGDSGSSYFDYNFTLLSEALEFLVTSKRNLNPNLSATITMDRNWNEQIMLYGVDLGWVTIDGNNITLLTNNLDDYNTYMGLTQFNGFLIGINSILPILNIGLSSDNVNSNIKNLICLYNSSCILDSCTFDNFQQGSNLAGDKLIFAKGDSFGHIYNCTIQNSPYIEIGRFDDSRLLVEDTDISGISSGSYLLSHQQSTGSMRGCDFDNGVINEAGGHLHLDCNVSGILELNVYVGGIISLETWDIANINMNVTKNQVNGDGMIIHTEG